MARAAFAAPQELRIEQPGAPTMAALLGSPEAARGLIIFAHGSGSGRHSPRNNHVAGKLREAGFATLLLDLLTPDEEDDRRKVFDIELLASRLEAATDWAAEQSVTSGLPVGYFGASTGAGAALVAAADRQREVAAVVSRGGRPDLAMSALPRVTAPTLLLVGGLDTYVIELNRAAKAQMRTRAELAIIPQAGHLFEEPGKLDEVISYARAWFAEHLMGPRPEKPQHDRPPAHLR